MRKLKSLVCGSKFGQFYIDAISKMKECVEFIGIFSNGSERSRLCAEKYNVNLYTSIDKIPEDIDIVFIAVRTGVMGGDGSELALKFLSKGIHVFIEQPIHIDEMKKCVKCSIEKGVFFHVANFYKYMDTVHKYIECSKGLLRKNEILSIECACANQVIYSLLDNILRIFREKARFSIENFWIQNQDFFIALSEIVSYIDQIILKKEVNSRYEDAEVNEEELGKLKIHKKGKEDKLVVIFHAGLGSIDEFLPFIQGLCNEEKGTIVSIALNNVKQYLDFYAGHLYESVADKYTKIILDLGYDKIQLIGHCVGGMIAFEVAKNMMDKGVDVIDVSLIDSIPGKYSIEDEVVMELMFLPMVNITYPVLAEYQLNERELYEYMDEKFGKYTGIEQKSKNKVEEYINGLREIEKEERIRLYINSVSKNMPIQMFVYLFDIFKQSTNGAIYKPIPYLGDIRLFIAEDTEKIVFHRSEEVINFWRENCIGDVTVIMIPGNHLTCFTDVNNIQKLVNMITEK